MVIHIKNMVCNRCKMVVREEFVKHGIVPERVELGEVLINDSANEEALQRISDQLHTYGFEILDDKRSTLIEKVKNLIIQLVYENNSELKVNLSSYLAEQTDVEYSYLTGLFSEIEGITIEKYFIAQRIERVKELLIYDELTISEIAFKMNYSSVAHLSNQFKKVTGLTPGYYKRFRTEKRRSIDSITDTDTST